MKRPAAAGRLGWGVADQGMSSLSNFIVGAYVAKTQGAAALGVFALALIGYGVILNASRGLSTDPLMVRYSDAPTAMWRRAAASASGVALLGGVAGGLLVLPLGVVLTGVGDPQLGAAFVALALGLPGLLLQDAWRYAFFSAGQGSKAFVNDAVWTVVMVGGLAAAHLGGLRNVAVVVGIFGGSATVAALVGALQARVAPAPMASRSWLSTNTHLGPRFLAENVIMSMSGQVRAVVLAAATGLAAVGQVRAIEMLFGPFLVVMRGLAQVAVPEGVRWVPRGRRAFQRFCIALGAGIAVVALGYGAAIAVLLPRGVGDMVLGDVWQAAYQLTPGAIVIAMGGGVIVGASAGLRALGRADRSLRAQVIASLLAMLGGGVGALGWGAPGAVWGGAVAAVAGAAVWWTALLSAAGEHYVNGVSPMDTKAPADGVGAEVSIPTGARLVTPNQR